MSKWTADDQRKVNALKMEVIRQLPPAGPQRELCVVFLTLTDRLSELLIDYDKLQADLAAAERTIADQSREIERLRKDAAWLPDEGAYVIHYDDVDRNYELFVLAGAKTAAFKRYEQISVSWNAHLFVKINSNSRDVQVPDAALNPEAPK